MHTQRRFSCFLIVSLTGRTLLPADIVALYYLYFSECFLWETYKIIFIYLYCDLVTWNQMNIAVASLNLCCKQHRACAESLTQPSSPSPFPCVERQTSRVSISSAKRQNHSAHSWELCIKGSFSITTNCHMYDWSNHLPEGSTTGPVVRRRLEFCTLGAS